MKIIYGILLLLLFGVPVFAEDLQGDPTLFVTNLIKQNQPLTSEQKVLLSHALNRIVSDEFESSRRKIVRPDSLEVLEKYSNGDPELSKVLSLLLTKSAEEALLQAELERVFWLIEEAKKVYPEPFAERDDILAQLQAHPLLKQNTTVSKLPLKESIRKKIVLPEKLNILLLVAGALWLISILSYSFGAKTPEPKTKKKQKQQPKLKIKVKSSEHKDKRSELLEFFDLDENSTEDDLARSYRKMAKAVHPDFGEHGKNYDFHKLQDMFEQANRVIFKKKN